MPLYDLTSWASMSASCAGNPCRAAIQTGRHTAQSYRSFTSQTDSVSHILVFTAVSKLRHAKPGLEYLACHIYCSPARLTDRKSRDLRAQSKMQTSSYLRRVLFHQLSQGTDQFLETKSKLLFQRPGGKSFIDIRHQQQPGQQGPFNHAYILDDEEALDWKLVAASPLSESCCSSLHKDPQPAYDDSPGLLQNDIRDHKDLQYIESVSASMAALSLR